MACKVTLIHNDGKTTTNQKKGMNQGKKIKVNLKKPVKSTVHAGTTVKEKSNNDALYKFMKIMNN